MEVAEKIDARAVHDSVHERWGAALDVGFTAVPNALIRAQARLGLTPNDVVVVLNLMDHWRHRDVPPMVQSSTIARRSGLSSRTVQRSLESLASKGLVRRVKRASGKREYDVGGLQRALVFQARHLKSLGQTG